MCVAVPVALFFSRILPHCWPRLCLVAMQLKKVKHVVELSKNDSLPLDYASQLCNSDILSRCTHFIAFAFHDSDVMYVVRWFTGLRLWLPVVRCPCVMCYQCKESISQLTFVWGFCPSDLSLCPC